MIRVFSLLSALIMVMVVIIGGGTYWISESKVSAAYEKATEASARGVALSVSHQLNILQATVTKMASTPMVVSALKSQDTVKIAEIATTLEQLLPYVMKIRILPANVSELDDTSVPHMGNADLIMTQETLEKPSMPSVQGLASNRHLAITAIVKSNEEVIGVILASLKFDFLPAILRKLEISDGFIELKQKNIVLAKAGDIANKTDKNNAIKVPKTSWSVRYWGGEANTLLSLGYLSFILLPFVLIILALLLSYQYMTRTIKQDLASILKAIKDIVAGKQVGSYPMNLAEMKSMVSNIVQFKRVQENEGKDFSVKELMVEDNFFSESSNSHFLNENIEFDSSQFTDDMPASLPSEKEYLKDFPSIEASSLDEKKSK